MPEIVHQLDIQANISTVFFNISTPNGLDHWWTLHSTGETKLGAEFTLGFGPEFQWKAVVSTFELDHIFELSLTEAGDDWINTKIRIVVSPSAHGQTTLQFSHSGWPSANEHWRVSGYCWAMYLRLLRRWVEFGELIPYEERLDV